MQRKSMKSSYFLLNLLQKHTEQSLQEKMLKQKLSKIHFKDEKQQTAFSFDML